VLEGGRAESSINTIKLKTKGINKRNDNNPPLLGHA
jgi:hypothetical protein